MKTLGTFILLFTSTLVMFNQNGSNSETPPKGYEYLDGELSNSKTYTLDMIEGFPEDEFSFKPADDMRSFGAQAFHIAYSLEWFNGQLSGNPVQWEEKDEDAMSKEELIVYTTEQFDAFINIVHNTEENGKFTSGILSTLRHNSHHRGQMVAYYRAIGMAPPAYK